MSAFTKGPYYWTKQHGCTRLMAAHSGQLVVLDSVAVQRPSGDFGADLMFSDRDGELRGGILDCAMKIDLDLHPDARLLKHAPDLYEACRAAKMELSWILANYPDREGGAYRQALDKLDAALAAVDGVEVAA